MRFMFLLGGGGLDNRVEAGYEISFVCTGGTLGLIGDRVSAICPASMLVTGDGTLLVATGYGPMQRMRQNEKTLTEAGVPAPTKAPYIAKETDFTASSQPAIITMHFDYSRFGSLAKVFDSRNHLGFVYTPEGEASLAARKADKDKYKNLFVSTGLGDDIDLDAFPGEQLAHNGYRNFSDAFLGQLQFNNTPLYFGGVMRITYRWTHLVFDLQIKNQASTDSDVNTTYTGNYQTFMRYVDKDGKLSNPSPISDAIVITAAPYIYYTDLEVPTDPRVRRRQIFRNINGSSDAFYLDIDTEDLTSTELISRNTDAQLKLNFGQPVWDDNGYNLFYLYGLPPNDKPYIAEFNSRIFAAGFRIYLEGNIGVTNGSDTVTGIGTAWTQSFIGRKIIIGQYEHTIIDLEEVSPQIIKLDKAYAGATNPYADYSIQPFYGNSNLLYFTEAGLPEAWNPNPILMPDDNDEITGLVTFANSLWILKNNSIYQFNTTIDPNRDGDYKPVSNRGCVNQRCAVQIQSVCLMLDRAGIHVFRGMLPRNQYQVNSTPDHLSKPVGDLFRFEGTWLRLNWDADKCFWHAAHNKELTTVRWYVTMQGYHLPQHAICYDYLADRWWVEEYPFPISASCQSAVLSGKPVLGGYGGKIYQPDLGSLDMIAPEETRRTVTGCIAGVIVQLDAAPPSCVGMMVAIVAGRGRGQQARILAQSGTEIEVDTPLSVYPDETSIVQIGAIKYYAQTGEFNYARLEQLNPQAVAYLFTDTTVPLEAYISIIRDGVNLWSNVAAGSWGCVSTDPDDNNVFKVNMTDTAGFAKVNLDGWTERDIPNKYSIQAQIEGFSGQEKPVIENIYIIGASLKPDMAVA